MQEYIFYARRGILPSHSSCFGSGQYIVPLKGMQTFLLSHDTFIGPACAGQIDWQIGDKTQSFTSV